MPIQCRSIDYEDDTTWLIAFPQPEPEEDEEDEEDEQFEEPAPDGDVPMTDAEAAEHDAYLTELFWWHKPIPDDESGPSSPPHEQAPPTPEQPEQPVPPPEPHQVPFYIPEQEWRDQCQRTDRLQEMLRFQQLTLTRHGQMLKDIFR